MDKIAYASFALFNKIGKGEDMIKRRVLRVHGRATIMLLSACLGILADKWLIGEKGRDRQKQGIAESK